MSHLAENLQFRIAQLRPEKTLNGVAVAAGVSQSVLYKACNEPSYTPKQPNLERLAKFFRCSIDELFIPVPRIVELNSDKALERQFLIDFRRLAPDGQAEVWADVKRRLAYNEAVAHASTPAGKNKNVSRQ